jgi:hypothetical protein
VQTDSAQPVITPPASATEAPTENPPPPPGAPMPPESEPIGSAHPTLVVTADPDARWVVLCQARKDTNRDGKTEVQVGYHGDTYGDDLLPYLVLGSGEGTAIDAFVSSDGSGRQIAYVQGKGSASATFRAESPPSASATRATIQSVRRSSRGVFRRARHQAPLLEEPCCRTD